ncbi:MAG: hypothetical protein JEY97_15655 [Bacteroidales bacterium]|nr:hypothetical protein [Bacteroidales bacterium]
MNSTEIRKTNKEKLLEKREDSFYDWSLLLDKINKKIQSNECSCILVSAPFGWGKSSFTNIVKNELKKRRNPLNDKKEWEICVINTWKYELLEQGDVVSQLIFDILDNFFKTLFIKYLKPDLKEKLKAATSQIISKPFLINIGKDLVKTAIANLPINIDVDLSSYEKFFKNPFFQKCDEIKSIIKENYISVIDIYKELSMAFLEEISKDSNETKNINIILIFRDCDRCSPENLLKIIDILHHINIDEKIKFIVEADENTIKSILCKKYHFGDYFSLKNDKIDPNRHSEKFETLNGYLDKIFDERISLERQNLNKSKLKEYLNNLFGNKIINEESITFDAITKAYHINYRFIKNQIEDVFLKRLNNIPNLIIENAYELNALILLHLVNEIDNKSYERVIFPKIMNKPSGKESNKLLYSVDNNISIKNNLIKKFGFSNKALKPLNQFNSLSNIDIFNSIYIHPPNNQRIMLFNFEIGNDSVIRHYSKTSSDLVSNINDIINSVNEKWNMYCS